jgi:uncharacterized protein DUF6338
MSATQVADSLLLLAPGFIYLKIISTFAEPHRRLEWEWVVWSLIAALPLAVAASVVRLATQNYVSLDADTWTTVEVGARFALALVLGALSAAIWRAVRRSGRDWAVRLRRIVSDSAWDVVLDDAARKKFGVEVTVMEGDKPVIYYGKVGTFGYEAAGVEPWIYLRFVQRWEGPDRGYEELDARTDGMLFHKDEIKRLRFIQPEGGTSTTAPQPGAG